MELSRIHMTRPASAMTKNRLLIHFLSDGRQLMALVKRRLWNCFLNLTASTTLQRWPSIVSTTTPTRFVFSRWLPFGFHSISSNGVNHQFDLSTRRTTTSNCHEVSSVPGDHYYSFACRFWIIQEITARHLAPPLEWIWLHLPLNDKRLCVHYLISGAQEGSNGYWCKASESAHESERADWQANRRRPICMMSVSQTYTAVVLGAFSVGINVPGARNTLHSSTE